MGLHSIRNQRRQHVKQGERIRWLKAIPVPEGVAGRTTEKIILEEQTLSAVARFLVSSTTEDEAVQPFGIIKKGTMQISAFPDWARFNHNDRVILTAPGRLLSQVMKVTRGATDTDSLSMPHVVSITNVWVDGIAVASSNYEAVETGIKWLEEILEEGDVYSVEYLHAPRYLVQPQSHRTSPTDRNGISLPLRYWLQREQNTGN